MQHTFCAIVFILLLNSCGTNTETPPVLSEEVLPEASTIHQLVQDAFDGVWSDLDSSSLVRLHTADFQLLEHGEVWTNDTIFNYQRRAKVNVEETGVKRTNHLEFLATELREDIAWTSYHNYGTWTVGADTTGQAHWLESAVAVKTDDGWKLQMLHSTRVRE